MFRYLLMTRTFRVVVKTDVGASLHGPRMRCMPTRPL